MTATGKYLYCRVTATNASGSSSANSNIVGPVTEVMPTVGTEATAWINAVTTAGGAVSAARRTLINNLIVGLQTDAVWTLLDRLWIFAAEDQPSGDIDLKALSVVTPVAGGGGAIPVTPPALLRNRGYRGNSINHIDSNFNPTVGTPNYTLNSASYFVYDRTSGTNAGFQVGMRVVSPGVWLSEMSLVESGTTCMIRVNDGSGGAANTNTQGFWIGSRTDASTLVHYKNGAVFNATPSAATSSGVPNLSFWILDCNFAGSGLGATTDTLACVGFGGGLDATKAAALTTRIETYMDAVGAGVI